MISFSRARFLHKKNLPFISYLSSHHKSALIGVFLMTLATGAALAFYLMPYISSRHDDNLLSQWLPPSTYSASGKCNAYVSMDWRSLNNYKEITAYSPKGKKIFFGDSVVEGMRNNQLLNFNYTTINVSGQVVYCALADIDYLLNMKPREVIIYMGGNDADGQSWYSAEEAVVFYEQMVRTLLDQNISVVLHGVHLGYPARRDRDYVEILNAGIEKIAQKYRISYIPPVDAFDFSAGDGTAFNKTDLYNDLTYDGEHLRGKAYKIWIDHINRYITH